MKISPLIILLFGLNGCQPTDKLGQGFYVTYVDLPVLRGVYYDNQNVHSDGISVGEVFYNDSVILYSGHPFINKTNTPDTSITLYYLIDKQAYKKNPDQLKSVGQIGPISITDANKFVKGLKELKHKKWHHN